MKKKIFIGVFIIIFVLLLNFIYFVTTVGMYSNDPPSLGEKISSAFAHPFWLSPYYIIIISVSNPIFTLFLIVLIVIMYYLYDNFIRNKKDDKNDISIGSAGAIENQDQSQLYDENSKIEFLSNVSTQAKSSNRAFKKVVLWGTLAIAIWAVFVFSVSSGPGEGMIGLMLFMPVMPIVYIFYPVYFVILSIRYSKEKSGMDSLDKIMFYVLAVPIISLGVFAVYRVYSGNLIQEAFTNNSNTKKVVEKQAGPVDLVIKDIYASSEKTGIEFCNESTNDTVKKVSIKIETDKNFSSIIDNYPSLPPGECQVAQLFTNYLKLKKGDSAKITVTINPKNKISETNMENNKMTKEFSF
jgi:hypothetical protein